MAQSKPFTKYKNVNILYKQFEENLQQREYCIKFKMTILYLETCYDHLILFSVGQFERK